MYQREATATILTRLHQHRKAFYNVEIMSLDGSGHAYTVKEAITFLERGAPSHLLFNITLDEVGVVLNLLIA